MKEKIVSYLTWFLSILFIPYLFTIIINGAETALLAHPADIESCIPFIVSLQIPKEYEIETIKSQTVIARTNLYRELDGKENFWEILKELKQELSYPHILLRLPEKKFQEALKETKGEVLSLNGELVLVPYHALSSGKTRDGEEVFHDAQYSYLKSVDSSMDKESPEYLNSTYFSSQQMPNQIEIKKRDTAGYVSILDAEGNIIEGEAFREGMGLASSNFTIQNIGDKIRFLCKGKGHGLGFSQYGGNVLAQSGENYVNILETYFPELVIESVESIF